MSFSKDMDRIIKGIEVDIKDKVVHPAMEKLVEEVAKATPKDTGNLTANWNLALNKYGRDYRELFGFVTADTSVDIMMHKLNRIKDKYKIGDEFNMNSKAPYSTKILLNGKSIQLARGELYMIVKDIENAINKGVAL